MVQKENIHVTAIMSLLHENLIFQDQFGNTKKIAIFGILTKAVDILS